MNFNSKRGFIPILILLPIAVLGIVTLEVVSRQKNGKASNQTQNTSSTESANGAESASPSPDGSPSPTPDATPTPTPTPAEDSGQYIEYTSHAQAAPTPTPTPKPPTNPSNTTSGANYTVSTFNLGSTTVVTDSANDDDCTNNCPVKPLSSYVSENGGRAGINGTYFCPSDYGWCASKVNTYDFPVWNNRKKKWMRADTLFWNGRGMMVFRSGSAQFFPNAATVGAPSDITGGIVNYPSLVAGGQSVLNEDSLSDNLKVTKGTRSAIGFGNGKLFLVVARSANMRDLVNIFLALGATDALNLDGGGSSALYDGGFKAGPGRNLPNAVIIK